MNKTNIELAAKVKRRMLLTPFVTTGVDANGTSLIDEITASYKDLVRVFGRPSDGDGYKTDAEWCLKFADGTIATIYNWKDGKNYEGKNGTPKTKITNWHIGGFSTYAVSHIRAHLETV